MINLITQFNNILPLACNWAATQEALILQNGRRLSNQLLLDAMKIGIVNPDKVRISIIPSIPIPEDSILKEASVATGLVTKNTAGLTLRYGIYIREDCASNYKLHLHELVHVAQYERLGSIEAFLKQYLYEVVTIGYPDAPMEQEAVRMANSIQI